MQENEYEEQIKKRTDEIKINVDRIFKDIKQLSRMDREKESLEVLRRIERSFTSVGEDLRMKREEMESQGVRQTVKADVRKASDTPKKVALHILDSLEKTSSDIRRNIEEKI